MRHFVAGILTTILSLILYSFWAVENILVRGNFRPRFDISQQKDIISLLIIFIFFIPFVYYVIFLLIGYTDMTKETD